MYNNIFQRRAQWRKQLMGRGITITLGALSYICKYRKQSVNRSVSTWTNAYRVNKQKLMKYGTQHPFPINEIHVGLLC